MVNTTTATTTTTCTGRIRLKVRRKQYTLLSLDRQLLAAAEDADNAAPPNTKDDRIMVRVDKTLRSVHPLCLFLQAVVRVEYTTSVTCEDRHPVATAVTLVTCPPSPIAVRMALEDVSLWHTLPSDYNDDFEHPTHTLVQALVAQLAGRPVVVAKRTNRLPQVRKRDLALLEAAEREVGLVELYTTRTLLRTKSAEEQPLHWNLPAHCSPEDPSAHGSLTRGEYLTTKKHPQLAWMVQRVKKLIQRHACTRILDVGGGRGDLAVALLLAYTTVTVTIVDCNPTALEAARLFAERHGVVERLETCAMEFDDFVAEHNVQTFDLVVALHACGDLSDAALRYAVDRCQAPFVVCPCCFGKVSMPSVATRMAELSQRPEYSRRGMHVVNSQRCRRILKDNNNAFCVQLEEYDRAWSSRNQVLIGWPNSNEEAGTK